MRLRAILFAVAALAGFAAGAHQLAQAAAAYFERAARAELADALTAAGQDWARVRVDGLVVELSGEAPDETSRFRALETAKLIVDPARIIDASTARAPDPLTPPDFALELLRNDAEISLIGLVPATSGEGRIVAALSGAAGVTDMLETADYPEPDGWSASLDFGLALLREFDHAKISVRPGAVTVAAAAASDADRSVLESRLRAAAPAGVSLGLEISAPRPVIAPFTIDFSLARGVGRFASCTAETEAQAAAILAAAAVAGHPGGQDCAVGLGAPSPDWDRAVIAGVEAVAALGGGRFAIRDIEAVLTAPDGVAPETLAPVGRRLAATLPAVFSLETVTPPHMVGDGDGPRIYAPRFEAVLEGDGSVRLSGPLQNDTSRAAVASYTAALFGHDRVTDATVVDPQLPEGWPGRVLAGVEGLAHLKEGSLRVTLEEVELEGWGIEADVGDKLDALFRVKAGAPARLDVSFDAAAAAAAARTPPEICAEDIAAVLDAGSIEFAAGSAEIEDSSMGVIAAAADLLRDCPGAFFEIAGHTDSQGPAESNQDLSEARAAAVMAALIEADLPLIRFRARGYGAERPVADNDSAEGRRRNRRIEITLVTPETLAGEERALIEASVDDIFGDITAEGCAEGVAAAFASGSIQFPAGDLEMEAQSAEVIRAVARALRACPGASFEVAGHTDSLGAAAANQRLSQLRAETVRDALLSESLDDVQLVARGYGPDQPIADNDTEEGRAQNRRIELTMLAAPVVAAPGAVASTAMQDCGRRIAIRLADEPIQFDLGSSAISGESVDTIAALAELLNACPGTAFEVAGHTDDRGSAEGNLELSRARAEAVRQALEEAGLAEVRLTARGYGEALPVADNGSSDGRARNRRIEIAPIGRVTLVEARVGPQ